MSLKSRGILMSKQIYGSVLPSISYFLFTAPNDIGMSIKNWKIYFNISVLDLESEHPDNMSV